MVCFLINKQSKITVQACILLLLQAVSSTYLCTGNEFRCSHFLPGGTCLSPLVTFGIEAPKSRHEARHLMELQVEDN